MGRKRLQNNLGDVGMTQEESFEEMFPSLKGKGNKLSEIINQFKDLPKSNNLKIAGYPFALWHLFFFLY